MRAYVIRRLLQSLIVIKVVLVVVFVMLHLTGDPADVLMPEDSTLEDVAEFRKAMGFDKPLHVQYYNFLFGFGKSKGVLRADFGYSFRHELPAVDLVLEHFPATIDLAIVAVIISIVVALPTGILSATFRNTWIDHISSVRLDVRPVDAELLARPHVHPRLRRRPRPAAPHRDTRDGSTSSSPR